MRAHSGKKPFKGDSPQPSTLETGISPLWNPILQMALAKNRDERGGLPCYTEPVGLSNGQPHHNGR